MPILAAFVVSLAHFIALYRLRVADPARPDDRRGRRRHVGAVDGGAGGRLRRVEGEPALHAHRQGRRDPKGPDFPAFWEAVLAALLLIGAVIVVATNYKQIHEINIFALVLVVQSLPFLAAVAIAALEGSRFNEFAYWRSIEAKCRRCPAPPRSPRRPALLRQAVETAISDADQAHC